MDSEQEMSIEERLAQAMIELRKGKLPNMSIHQRRDYLIKAIHDLRQDIEQVKRENDILFGFKRKAEFVISKICEISDINVRELSKDFSNNNNNNNNDTKDIAIATEPLTSTANMPPDSGRFKDKYQLIHSLINEEKKLKDKLSYIETQRNYKGPNYILVKKRDYHDLCSKIEKISTDQATSSRHMETYDNHTMIINNISSNHLHQHHAQNHHSNSNHPKMIDKNQIVPQTQSHAQLNQQTIVPSSTLDASSNVNNNNGIARVYEESDDEGVQLLLSMKRNVFNCKCGEYLNSITDWSEHQKICSRSTEKTIGEQCQLCKKTFQTCVALNIHSTKKHNKKKLRTDSVMHCPCGQSFTAKWRQNCVHKLNSHGRHCKAFKEKETQCSICKKGFIDKKSLEYHGLKAHKLAVPVNS